MKLVQQVHKDQTEVTTKTRKSLLSIQDQAIKSKQARILTLKKSLERPKPI